MKMKLCTCFLLFRIFAFTISSPLHSPKEYKRDINLDLEGVLEVNVDKNSIIISEKKLTGYNKISRRDSRPPRVETFTGFIQKVINILHTYDDNTFEDFFHILDKEIRKYYKRGFRFHELTEDYEIKNLLADTFDLTKGKSIRDVAEIIKLKINHKNVKQLLNYINSLYREDDREKFEKVLTDLKVFKNSNNKEPKNDLAKIIRNGLQAIIFNHYKNLNAKEKRGLKKEIVIFLKGLTENPSANSKANFIPPKLPINELNSNNYKDVIALIKKPEILKKSDATSTTVQNKANKRRKFHRKKTNDELSENEGTMLETSEDESDSQELVLTFASTDEVYHENTEGSSGETSTDESSHETLHESSVDLSQEQHRKLNAQPYDTLYIEDFYMSTEKPTNEKEKLKSKLEKGMSIEESTDRLPTARLRHRTTTQPAYKEHKVVFRRARPSQTTSRFISYDNNDNLSDKDLRRSIAPPIPNEELSVEVFERERRKREKALAESYRFVSNNSIQHGLKDYIKRRRHLDKTINELKKIQEDNQRSRVNFTTYSGDKVKNAVNKFEAKENIYENRSKPIEGENIKETKVVSETQSNMYEARAQTEENDHKVKETQDGINKTTLFNKFEQDIENKKERVKSLDESLKKLKEQKKVKRIRSKKSTNAQTTGSEYKYSTETITTPSKQYTSILESVNMPVFKDQMTTAKDNEKFNETTSEATIQVDNATLNDKKEIIIKNNATTGDIDEDIRRKLNLYVVVTPSTRRQRRVLQYSSPPF